MPRAPFRNRLLNGLERDDLALLHPFLKPVEIRRRKQLELPLRKIETVFFPEVGVVSITVKQGHVESEVAVIGSEGVTGTALLMDTDRSINSCMMQVAGYGHTMMATDFLEAMDKSENLRSVMLRFVQAYAAQASYNVVTNAHGTLLQRLARWLLMAHDRMDSDTVAITHEFLSMMMGCRRPGVTEAVHILAGDKLISTHRGEITILDRDALKLVAGAFYGLPEQEYNRLLGHSPHMRPANFTPLRELRTA